MQHNVSHETQLLNRYVELLLKWQTQINLVGPTTLDSIFERHIFDSLQLSVYCTKEKQMLDIGSGAGLPGIPLAIYGHPVTMIESDKRKAAFIRTAIADLGLSSQAINNRIENTEASADIIVSRALAPLHTLLELSSPKLRTGGFCLFLKGENYAMESEQARKKWDFAEELFPSRTSQSGVIARISGVQRRG